MDQLSTPNSHSQSSDLNTDFNLNEIQKYDIRSPIYNFEEMQFKTNYCSSSENDPDLKCISVSSDFNKYNESRVNNVTFSNKVQPWEAGGCQEYISTLNEVSLVDIEYEEDDVGNSLNSSINIAVDRNEKQELFINDHRQYNNASHNTVSNKTEKKAVASKTNYGIFNKTISDSNSYRTTDLKNNLAKNVNRNDIEDFLNLNLNEDLCVKTQNSMSPLLNNLSSNSNNNSICQANCADNSLDINLIEHNLQFQNIDINTAGKNVTLDSTCCGAICPSCKNTFDQEKRRKLIDDCGHERCFSCMFEIDRCPTCWNSVPINESDFIKQSAGKPRDYNIGDNGLNLRKGDSNKTPLLYSEGDCALPLSTERQHGERKRSVTIYQPSVINKEKPTVATNLKDLESSDVSTYESKSQVECRRRLFNTIHIKSPFRIRRTDNSINASTLSEFSSPETSVHSESSSPAKNWTKQSVENKSSPQHRLSLSNTSTYAGHLSSMVYGKIKSLWTAQSSTANSGLNQLADNVQSNELSILDDAEFTRSSCEKNKASKNELKLRLDLFLQNNVEPDTSTVLNGSHTCSNIGSDTISSMMSYSMSEISEGQPSSLFARHSKENLFRSVKEVYNPTKTTFHPSSGLQLGNNPYETPIYLRSKSSQLTLKPLFFEIPLQEENPIFTGRNWVYKDISNIFVTTETRGVLINGSPGTGKTTIILQLVINSCFGITADGLNQEKEGIMEQINISQNRIKMLASQVVAYHFCQADNNSTCLVPDFIHSIAAQLCQAPQLASYYDYLLHEPFLQNTLSVNECIADPEKAFKKGIIEPLNVLKLNGTISSRNCIILVDGLCEAEYHRPDHGDTISSFLLKITENFPPWLRVIATVRTQMMDQVKALPFTKLSLDNWSTNENIQKDICEYICMRINQCHGIQSNSIPSPEYNSFSDKFTRYMFTLSNGSFLFAKLNLNLIEQGYLVIKSTNFKVLPVSLSQIFLLLFNLRFTTTTAFQKVVQIINICLATLYPLTINEIFLAVNSLNVEDNLDWDEFLFRFNQLSGFLIKRLDNTYMFFHSSFREWLMRRNDKESTKFVCDLRVGHAGLAFWISRMKAPLHSNLTLELAHHILKARLFPNVTQITRDMNSYWLESVTYCVSSALCILRNVYNSNIKVSRLLLLAGASPNFTTKSLGNAPILCISAHLGNVPMVSLLLEFGADVELSNSQGKTPLIFAASQGHFDIVRQLVANGTSLGHVDNANRCALVYAVINGYFQIVKYLLACNWNSRSDSVDISLQMACHQALISASMHGHFFIFEDLIDISDININSIDILTGETALTAAATNYSDESVSALLSLGAEIDLENENGMTGLLIAVKMGFAAVVGRLLYNNANIEHTDSSGKTAIIIASEKGHTGIIELLCDHGANVNAQDKDGMSALSWACLHDNLPAVKCLITRNANIHHTDKYGRTTLDFASYHGSASLVKMLLNKGVNIEHEDLNRIRPLEHAINCNNIQVVHEFLRHGAKLGPATWTMATRKPEILLLLLNKLLEDGNILLRQKLLEDAAHRYHYALKKFPQHTDVSPEYFGSFLQLKINFLINYSKCKRKMNDIMESIKLASNAIELRPDHYEGYYARSKAYMQNQRFTEARMDAKLALKNSFSASIEIRKALIQLHDDIISFSERMTMESSDIITSSL